MNVRRQILYDFCVLFQLYPLYFATALGAAAASYYIYRLTQNPDAS